MQLFEFGTAKSRGELLAAARPWSEHDAHQRVRGRGGARLNLGLVALLPSARRAFSTHRAVPLMLTPVLASRSDLTTPRIVNYAPTGWGLLVVWLAATPGPRSR
jgi:hypothetical protein